MPQTSTTEPPQIKNRIGAILRATSGNFLEQFDFFLFGFYASAIAKAWVMPVFISLSSTLASGTEAPPVSVTVPLTLPRPACDVALGVQKTQTITNTERITARNCCHPMRNLPKENRENLFIETFEFSMNRRYICGLGRCQEKKYVKTGNGLKARRAQSAEDSCVKAIQNMPRRKSGHVTLSDVAQAAGFAVSTVSIVLSEAPLSKNVAASG